MASMGSLFTHQLPAVLLWFLARIMANENVKLKKCYNGNDKTNTFGLALIIENYLCRCDL